MDRDSKSLLNLTTKDLEREIDKIASNYQARTKQWTPKEIEILRKMRHKGLTFMIIAKTLKRKPDAVRMKWNSILTCED